MKYEEVEIIEYIPGNEDAITPLLHSKTKPVIFRIPNFPNTFDLDFFTQHHDSASTYHRYRDGKEVEFGHARFREIIEQIKEDQPVRIFGEAVAPAVDSQLLQAIPLWRKIPFRPRYFQARLGSIVYFFGGKGAITGMHYDREFNSILHICLHGKKRVLMFTVDDSANIYKTPFISDTLINFALPIDKYEENFPRLKNAVAYDVVLEPGDMLYMPKRCWHHIEYLAHNASATLPFYPNKIDQFLGLYSGLFYLGFSDQTLSLNRKNWFKKFAYRYARSEGLQRMLMRGLETLGYVVLFPICIAAFLVRYKVKGGKLY